MEKKKIKVNTRLKRVCDLAVSLMSLPLILPVIGIIAILIKLDTKGPVFFIQERLGKDKKIFKCLKFRTMYPQADQILTTFFKNHPEIKAKWEKYKKIKGCDPRVTRIGRFLRRFSLDELPQIFNILKGEMSLIGPRPYLPTELPDMGAYTDIILSVKPGLTGLWQVLGRNEIPFRGRLKLDAWYISHWSLGLDILIFFKTFKAVLSGNGAY
jgi:undecaprenyl-phosphate galactose phosphotransferase